MRGIPDFVERVRALEARIAHLEAASGTLAGSSIDHGGLDGLADDDHAQYLLADGTRAMTGQLSLVGDPTADAHAARKAYVDSKSLPPFLSAAGFADVYSAPSRGMLGYEDNMTPTWRLDAASIECVASAWCAPATGNLTIKLHYAMDTATSGNVVWTLGYLAAADGEDANAVGSTVDQVVGVPGTAKYLDVVTMSASIAVTAGDLLRLCVKRYATHASDTASGDAHFIGLLVSYT